MRDQRVYIPKHAAAAPRFGPWLSETFERFVDAWQVWVCQGLIVFVAMAIPFAVCFALFLVSYLSGMQKFTNATSGGTPPTAGQMLELITSYAWFIPLAVVTPVIWALLGTGMLRTAHKQLNGEPISVSDVFRTDGRYLAVLGLQILTTALSLMVDLPLCFLMGFAGAAVQGLLFFAHPLVVHGGLGVIEAMDVSYRTTKGHWIYYMLWAFVLLLLAKIGSMACYVGLIASLPLYPIATAIAYRDVFLTSAHLDPALERTFE